MNPVLYERNSDFKSTGIIGVLSDAISCVITEERNGAFTAELKYPIDGIFADQLEIGKYIGCAYFSTSAGFEYFEIYSISKTIAGVVTYQCRHFTYGLLFNVVEPFTLSSGYTPSQIWSSIQNHLINATNAVFSSDKTATGTFKLEKPVLLKSCLGGMEGSLLDRFGGEYEWTHDVTDPKKPKIILHTNRGADNDVLISYGLNIVNYKQDKSIEETVDGVILYYASETDCVYSDPAYVTGHTENRLQLVDVTEKYSEVPTVSALNTAAASYVTKNNIGTPVVNMDISFINLRDTEEYRDIRNVQYLENLKLCDTVLIMIGNGTVESKVVKVVYNVLLDKYDKISINDIRKDLVTTIVNLERAVY